MTHRTQPGPGARGWIRLMLAWAIFFAGSAHALTGQQLYDNNCGSGGCHSSPPSLGEAPITSLGNMPLNGAGADTVITFAINKGMTSMPAGGAADVTAIAGYLATVLGSPATNTAIPYNSPGVVISIPNHSAVNYTPLGPAPPSVGSPWGATTAFSTVTGPTKGTVTYSTSGTMTYTPTAGQFGTDSWTYHATGPGGPSSTRTHTVTIANPPPPVVTGATLTGQTGVFFTHTIVATNNPTSYAISGGSLPNGVTLNTSTGVISGTPTVVGAFSAQITATNAGGTSPAATFAITISLGPPVITSGTPATGAEGVVYGGYTITASNSPTSFNVVGSLPPGLLLNTATGAITGTPTVTAGPYPKTYTVTVQATNATGTGSASRTFTINKPVPTITSAATASGQTGVAFNYAITATQGPITSYSASALPAGLVFNTSTGVISGTPTAVGGPTSVTLTATNSTGTSANFNLDITITLGPPVINSTLAASAGEGQAFNYQITATNPPLTSYNATGLPSGLAVNTSTGQITGSPSAGTAAGSPYNVTISATNATATGSATLVITLSQFAPSITSTSPASGQTGVPFSYQITAANAPVTYNATGLPPGLSINTGTGLISGTPTTIGTFSGTMTAGNGSGSDTKPLVINITLGAPVVTSGASASGAAGFAFSYQITASNSPTSFGATGLPPGVTVNAATGLVSGTPSANGTFTATISATNATGTGTKTLTITIAVGLPVINSPATAMAATGAPFTYQVTATNSPTSFNAVNLPAGLSIDTTTGVISGQVLNFGGYDITLQATNGTGTGSRALTLTVSQSAPGMTSAATASGGVGQSFSFQVTSSNGPVRIDATGLPPGLAIDPTTGFITGTPTLGGTYPVRVSIANTQGTVVSTLTITIAFKAPTAQDLSVEVVYETPTPIALPVAGQVTQLTIVSLPNHGIVTVNGATATYTPANGYSGEDSFTYTASNPGGTTQVATVHINVGTLAPVASAATMLCDINKSATADLARYIKASGLTGVSITTQPLHGKVAVNGTQVTYTPGTDYFGPDSFAYVAYGNAGKSSPAPVSVTVVGRPDPTRDANVTGLLDAQAQAAQRFTNAQIGNFQRRMESLHNSPLPQEAARTASAAPAGTPAGASAGTPAPVASAAGSEPGATRAPAVGLMPVSLIAPFASLATTRALDLNASTGGTGAPAGWTDGVNAWIGGTAQFGRRDANNDVTGLRFTTDGISVGVDRRMGARLVLGLGVGYGRDDTDVGTAGSRSKAKGQSFALYGSYQPTANVFLDMLAGVGNLDFDTRRHVAAIDQFATGSRKGDQTFASLSAGAEWRREGVLLSPYGRVDVTDDRLKSYSESGVGDYALAYDAMHVRSTQVAAGMRVESTHGTDFGSVQPRLRAEYRRELRGDAQATLRYLDLFEGPQYTVTTKGVSRNALLLGVGSDFAFRGGLKVGIDYMAQRASGASNVQSVRLLVSQDLDARGSPFSWQPKMFKDPVGFEAGYTFDDNVTRGRNEAEKRSDSLFSLSAGQPIPFKLGALTNLRLVVTPAISGEMLRRYSGLARFSAGATGELQYRTSGAFDAMTYALVGRAGYDQYDSEVRRGARYFVGVNARRSLTDRIDLFAEAGRAMREGKSEVFQTREWSGKLNVDYALGGTRGILYLSGEYRRGDIVSTGVTSLANVGLADVFVPDDAFDGMFAYRFDGRTVLGTMGWNYPLGPRDSLDFSWRRVQSTPSGRTTWDSGSLRYIDNQYSLVYLMRF